MPLDYLDDLPRPMRRYIKYNGWHFNRAAYDFAASLMYTTTPDGKRQRVQPMTKEQVDTLLRENNVSLENTANYDYVYWAMQCRADLMPDAIEDARHQALYVKRMMEDPDTTPEAAFRCFYIKAVGNGTAIPFDQLLDS